MHHKDTISAYAGQPRTQLDASCTMPTVGRTAITLLGHFTESLAYHFGMATNDNKVPEIQRAGQ